MRSAQIKFALVLACTAFADGTASANEAIQWQTSFKAAMNKARSGNKLVMVDFYTDWCGYCKKLDRETYTNTRVIQLAAQVVPLKINAEKDEGPEAARKYSVHVFPTILFINSKGGVEGKLVGYVPPQVFSLQMSSFTTAHAEFPAAEARYKAHPWDAGLAIKMAGLYAGRGEVSKAENALNAAERSGHRPAGMAKAYGMVGDYFREARQFDKAIPFYKKSVKSATDSGELAYANLSIAAT